MLCRIGANIREGDGRVLSDYNSEDRLRIAWAYGGGDETSSKLIFIAILIFASIYLFSRIKSLTNYENKTNPHE